MHVARDWWMKVISWLWQVPGKRGMNIQSSWFSMRKSVRWRAQRDIACEDKTITSYSQENYRLGHFAGGSDLSLKVMVCWMVSKVRNVLGWHEALVFERLNQEVMILLWGHASYSAGDQIELKCYTWAAVRLHKFQTRWHWSQIGWDCSRWAKKQSTLECSWLKRDDENSLQFLMTPFLPVIGWVSN